MTEATALPEMNGTTWEGRGETRADLPAAASTRFRVGTLLYTRAGLVSLFVWLLWGDFCFTLMETVVPSVLPLKLRHLQASNVLMGLLITTIPSILNFTVCPIVSFRSDRYRSRWGRRIPFLFFATPFVTVFLLLMGYSEEISLWLGKWVNVSSTTLTLVLIGMFMVGFQFFNMFVASVYYYLFNDVVPDAFLARFMSLFKTMGMAAGALYNMFVYRYAESHMKEIFLGAGLLYFVAFTLMCLKGKEGEYPPPPGNIDKRTGIRASIKTYMVECFTHRFYWYFFLANALWAMSYCISTFGVFLSLSLGLNLDQLGKINAWALVVSAILLYPAGILSDRLHPLRVMIGAMVCMVVMTPINLVYLFCDFTPHTVLIIMIVSTVVGLPIGVMYNAAQLPMYMKLLPKDRYGQFGSADAMVRSLAIIVGGLLAGAFMDLMKGLYQGDPFYYRYIPCWSLAFQILAMIFMIKLYQGWQKQGGAENYAPPRP